jgi:branched-subunit amino acid aminotransferase/4-amino-4-deoxychorismate lyase
MAKFEGIKWAPRQIEFVSPDSKVYAVNRSIHYGIFLCFEGIRFYCRRNEKGEIEIVFYNWEKNLERFRRGMAFNLATEQHNLIPSVEELIHIFISYFKDDAMYEFVNEMVELDAQGYLRPFTVDEEQSIGVTFPAMPAIRAIACRYDKYLGEPFTGVVIPHLVRAVSLNGMGCLKLGVNYLISVKAIEEARKINPDAGSALFLDDKTYQKIEERNISEWDSSCCLLAIADNTVIKIPEHNLILPSVTIQGLVAILKDMGVNVIERFIKYGELIEYAKQHKLVAICSVGTAGILNRCYELDFLDDKKNVIYIHKPLAEHPLFAKLAEAKQRYWDIYKGKYKPCSDEALKKYIIK